METAHLTIIWARVSRVIKDAWLHVSFVCDKISAKNSVTDYCVWMRTEIAGEIIAHEDLRHPSPCLSFLFSFFFFSSFFSRSRRCFSTPLDVISFGINLSHFYDKFPWWLLFAVDAPLEASFRALFRWKRGAYKLHIN